MRWTIDASQTKDGATTENRNLKPENGKRKTENGTEDSRTEDSSGRSPTQMETEIPLVCRSAAKQNLKQNSSQEIAPELGGPGPVRKTGAGTNAKTTPKKSSRDCP